MTNAAFITWLNHFAKFKNSGPTLLIFDGAKSHLDIDIVEAAENHDITLFCLPSNTTHELQPMAKAVFRSYNAFWDQEVLNFLVTQPGKPLTKMRFGEMFSKVWLKAMRSSNIISGFRAKYPFCPDVTPESAYVLSLITHVEENILEDSDQGTKLQQGAQRQNTDPVPGTSRINARQKCHDILNGNSKEKNTL